MSMRRHQSLISKIILIVMMFAAMAPTVSHALASVTGNRAFVQKICTSNGDKVVIQVKTTMGKQLTTEFSLKTAFDRTADSQSSGNHFEHCPFCMSASTAFILPVAHALMIQKLEVESQKIALYDVPTIDLAPKLTPPSHAPPFTSIN